MEKYMFNKYLEKAVKPLRCICGIEHSNSNNYQGGFITNGGLIIWCCCEKCADRTLQKIE